MKPQRKVLIITLQMIAILLSFGIIRSQTWQFTNGPYRPHEVRDLSASLSGGVQRIYAADAETLKYSTNSGTSWLNTSSLMFNPLIVAAKPDDANIVHVAKIGELRLSTNGGGDWGVSPKISDPNLVPLRLSESMYNTNIWLLGADTVLKGSTWTSSLYRTTDGGVTWAAHNYFATNAHTNVNDHIFDPRTSSQYVWVGGSTNPIDQAPNMSNPQSTPTKGVWYSADGGANWSFRTNFPSSGSADKNVTAMALSDGRTSDILFAVTTKSENGILKAQLYQVSPDGGDIAWTTGANLYDDLDVVTNQPLNISLVRTLKVNPSNPDNLVVVTNKGVAVSTDRGAHWTLRSNPTNSVNVYQLVHDKTDNTGNKLFLGGDHSVHYSTNMGQSWSSVGFFSILNTTNVTVNGTTSHAVSNVYPGIAKFSNGAWDQNVKFVAQGRFLGYAIDINRTNTAYANAVGDSAGLAVIYNRSDGGDGWRKVFTSSSGAYSTPMKSIATDPNSQRVYAGGNFRIGSNYYNLLRSDDRGINWGLQIRVGNSDGVPVNALLIDASSIDPYIGISSVVYAGLGYDGGVGQGVWKTTNAGNAWPIARLVGDTINSIAMNSSSSSQVLYLGSPSFMWKSNDALATQPGILLIPFAGAKSIIMHPSYPNSTNFLWVVPTDGQRIYRTTNGGAEWLEVNTTNIPKPLSNLTIDPSSNTNIYVSTSVGVYSVNPPPETPAGFIIGGTSCTPPTCNTLLSTSSILSPVPGGCHPVLTWSANQEVDLSPTGTYELERSVDNVSWGIISSGTGVQVIDWDVTLNINGSILVYYRVKAKDAAGNYSAYSRTYCVYANPMQFAKSGKSTNLLDEQSITEFKLFDNYPNPFNPATKIRYSIPEQGHVRLVVYDILGREISTLVNEIQSAGTKEVEFNTSNFGFLPSGFYLYKLEAGSSTDIKKMLLLR